ncbi:IS5 family transposase [Blastopirellula marina]|uniref:IS5 family transposase n=1 Tax=Blastopirellula marina TaxID=124 RepID=UPI0028F4174B|nr:IS5 family transposase [Blastopirellula marina]
MRKRSTKSCGASMEPTFVRLAVRRGLKKGRSDAASDEALGRSRGGFSTKLHLLCDSQGNPLHACLSPGQRHESQFLEELLDGCEVCGDERDEAIWPVFLAGDKGYRADWIDEYLIEEGILPVIPSKEDEDRSARFVEFDREKYRRRNIIERLIGWLKECRRVQTRFEKLATNFLGMVKMAFIQRYLKLMTY